MNTSGEGGDEGRKMEAEKCMGAGEESEAGGVQAVVGGRKEDETRAKAEFELVIISLSFHVSLQSILP